MALSVDRVDFLSRELLSSSTTIQDGITILGIIYGCKLFNSLCVNGWKGLYGHILSKLYPVTNFSKHFGSWAIITQATNEVSSEFARQLARRGLNILLIDNDLNALKALAKDLERDFNIQVEHSNSFNELEAAVQKKSVGVLVNNCCFSDSPKYFTEMSKTAIDEILNHNIMDVTKAIHVVLPKMLIAQKGVIINFSSVASRQPIPLMQVFSATQAYIDYFTRALDWEYRDSNVKFQFLDPFIIKTNKMQSQLPVFIRKVSPLPEKYVQNSLSTVVFMTRTSGYWLHGIMNIIFNFLPISIRMHMFGYFLLYWRDSCNN